MLNYLPIIRKALVSGGVTLVLGVLSLLYITPGMTVEEAVAILVGAFVNGVLTWRVPNKK